MEVYETHYDYIQEQRQAGAAALWGHRTAGGSDCRSACSLQFWFQPHERPADADTQAYLHCCRKHVHPGFVADCGAIFYSYQYTFADSQSDCKSVLQYFDWRDGAGSEGAAEAPALGAHRE